MSDPMSVNFAAIQRGQARVDAGQTLATQVASGARFEEEVEEGGLTPAAARRDMEFKGRFRTLESRKKSEVPEEHPAIEQVEARSEGDIAHDFEQQNPELPADQLVALRQLLNEDQTAEEILAHVLKMFNDPTLADEAFAFLEQSTTDHLRSLIRKARELLNETLRREIIAGRNIDTAAKTFARKGIKSATELRNLYREVTGDPKPHNLLFEQLASEYTFEELQTLVEFLLQGMSYDLKSKVPSIQPPELQLLMTEIRNLQSIVWIYLFFKKQSAVMQRLYEQHGVYYNEQALNFQELAKQFVKIVEDRYPSALKILRQVEKMGVLGNEEKGLLLTQFRDAVRQLSPRLYSSTRHKQDLLLALISALEELEGNDEEEEES